VIGFLCKHAERIGAIEFQKSKNSRVFHEHMGFTRVERFSNTNGVNWYFYFAFVMGTDGNITRSRETAFTRL